MTNSSRLTRSLVEDHYLLRFFQQRSIKEPRGLRKMLTKQISETLGNPKVSIHYKENGEELTYFYTLEKSMDIGKHIIRADFPIAPKLNDKELDELISKVFAVDGRVRNAFFYVPIKSKLYKQLKSRGANFSGNKLLGSVDDGLRYLSQYEFDKDVGLSEFTNDDVEEAVELEFMAHGMSETSRCENMPRKMFRGFIKHVIANKTRSIVARENGVILGHCVVFKDSYGLGHIMSIAVHPDHQGRGVSKFLYYHAFKYFKSKNVKVYTGVSSTTQVLGLTKRLKREAKYAYLVLKRN